MQHMTFYSHAKRIGLLIAVLFSISEVAVSQMEATVVPKLKFTNSFFDDDDQPLSRLIALNWDGRKLRLRRDWREPGVEEVDPNDPIAAMRAQHRARIGTATKLGNEFSIVCRNLGCRSGGQSGSGKDSVITRRGENYYCMAMEGETDCRFHFIGHGIVEKRFEFHERDDGRLSMSLFTDDDIVQILQKKEGSVRITVIQEDNPVIVARAKDFRELYEMQPMVVKRLFLPFLEHLSIGLPLETDSEEIRDFVTKKLLADLELSDEDLTTYLKKLESNSFAERSQATEALRARFNVWGESYAKLIEDKSVPLETKMRLKSIVDESKARLNDLKSVREFVEQNALASKNDYLFSLITEKDEKIQKAVFLQVRKNDPELSTEQVEEKYKAWQESQTKSDKLQR